VSLLCQECGAEAPSTTARHKRNRCSSYAAFVFCALSHVTAEVVEWVVEAVKSA
jgi:hypothetical protein